MLAALGQARLLAVPATWYPHRSFARLPPTPHWLPPSGQSNAHLFTSSNHHGYVITSRVFLSHPTPPSLPFITFYTQLYHTCIKPTVLDPCPRQLLLRLSLSPAAVKLSPIHVTTYYYYPKSGNASHTRPVEPSYQYITPARTPVSTSATPRYTPPGTPPTPARTISPPSTPRTNNSTMGGRTMPASPKQVGFAGTVSLCRPPREDESYVMIAFANHAAHCPRCADPWAVHLAGATLCDRGHARARDVAQYVYNKAGLPFSVTDRVSSGDRVQIEIPTGCKAVGGLLKAINSGLRIRAKAEGRPAEVSHDRRYHVSDRTAPAPRKETRAEADVYEIRPGNSRREREERRERSRETRYVEGKGSGYRRDQLERQQRGREELDPVIIIAEPRAGRGRYAR